MAAKFWEVEVERLVCAYEGYVREAIAEMVERTFEEMEDDEDIETAFAHTGEVVFELSLGAFSEENEANFWDRTRRTITDLAWKQLLDDKEDE